MKHNTKDGRKKLPPAICDLIMRTQGLSAEIARVGELGKPFVSMVLSGDRQPSRRFLDALAAVLLERGNKYMNAAAAIELADLICQHRGHIAALRQ